MPQQSTIAIDHAKVVNVLLIGCGYHARRIYVPHIAQSKNIRLRAIVDIPSQKDII